ncbi:MAG: hypothetical protein PHU51_06130 [Candidatus Nanoarchaeia archaeon]|nr:hypothetical protein [Candidatus Nanoarchaeia archaeon]
MHTSKLLPILLLILLILPLTSAAVIQTKNNDYISSFSSGSSFEYKDLWSWQQLVGLNDPSPMDFIAVIAEAFVQLFSGNVPGFLSLAVLSSPFIGIFVLLFMMGHFVGSITLFRSEDHAHYRKYFGWGLALIGISTNKTFSIIYNFLGRLFTSIAFTLLFFFGIWMLMSHMRKRTLEKSTENYKLKQENLQLQKEGLTDEKEASELEKIAKKTKELADTEVMIEKREMMVLETSLNLLKKFYEDFKKGKFLASFKLNRLDRKKLNSVLDVMIKDIKNNINSYEHYVNEVFRLDSIEKAYTKKEGGLNVDLKNKLISLTNKLSELENQKKIEKTAAETLLAEIIKIEDVEKDLNTRVLQALKADKRDEILEHKQNTLIQIIHEKIEKLNSFKELLPQMDENILKQELSKSLSELFNQLKASLDETKNIYGIIAKKDQVDTIILQETEKIESMVKDVEQKLNSI